MKVQHRIQPEPLDDERWQEIERAVMRVAPGRVGGGPSWSARRAPVFAAGAVLVMAVAALWILRRPPAPSTPTQRTAVAPVGTSVAPAVFTSNADGSVVSLGDATLHLRPGAQVAVTRPQGGVRVDLSRGEVFFDVQSRGERPPLVVHAADVEVVVVGTQFTVRNDERIDVRVSEGVVRVRRGGGDVRVAAGESWSGETVIAKNQVRTASASPSQSPSQSPSPTQYPLAPIAKSPQPRPGSGSGALRPDPSAVSASRPGNEALSARIRRQLPRPTTLTATGAAQDRLDAYQDLLRSRGAEASAAQYAIALVHHRELSANSTALRALDVYLRRFAAGAELEDVLWMRIRILCQGKIDETCRAAAHTYLRHSPSPAARRALAEEIISTMAP